MTEGQKFIKENNLKELEYEQAIQKSMDYLRKELHITSTSQLDDNDSIYDNVIYPLNSELYDEFVENNSFDVLEFFLFIARRIELEIMDNEY